MFRWHKKNILKLLFQPNCSIASGYFFLSDYCFILANQKRSLSITRVLLNQVFVMSTNISTNIFFLFILQPNRFVFPNKDFLLIVVLIRLTRKGYCKQHYSLLIRSGTDPKQGWTGPNRADRLAQDPSG